MIPPDTASLSDPVGGNHSEALGSSTAAWRDVAPTSWSCTVGDDLVAP
jgi:hypothetical protein